MGVLRFKNIYFGSFLESSGVSQTVFTFLLIPCCFTLDFRAPPLIPNVPFLWAWNAPTELCTGRFDEPLDLSLFSLVGSPRRDVTGQDVTIFYVDRLGYYPYIDTTGKIVNGGIPQNGSLRKHLVKAEKDILYYMPTDNVGLAVIDWEEWRPNWERNWKPKDIYKNQSIKLVQQHNTHLSVTEAAKIAKVDFENASQSFMEETLKLGKLLRPNHLWGFYLFPDCYNNNYRQRGFNGSCFDTETRINDDLTWLWKESTALFPSIYLSTDMSSQQAVLFVRNRVHEAIRISKVPDADRPLPVFVYSHLVFTDLIFKFLSQDDLVHTLGESIALGASGVVIWGSLSVMRSMKSCLTLDKYVKTTLNPYLINVTLAAKMCSQVICQEQGVCTRKNWNSSDYLHLNPANFDIQIRKSGKYKVRGKPSLQDLQQLSEKFNCSCYPTLSCKERTDIKDINAIDVCVAEDVCIDVSVNLEPHYQPSPKKNVTFRLVSSSPSSATVFFVNILFLTMSSSLVK
ncbi:hyaluronidase PH-20-like [Microcebus murinus]|uniref:hyaluronidase PH-20-like n=1 Tax=Microcebus murinus TaxID=30608 RepID=UPI003F6CF84D